MLFTLFIAHLLRWTILTVLSCLSGMWMTCLNWTPLREVAIWSSLRRWSTRRPSGWPQRSWRSPTLWRGWKPSSTSSRSPFTAESARTSTPCSLLSGWLSAAAVDCVCVSFILRWQLPVARWDVSFPHVLGRARLTSPPPPARSCNQPQAQRLCFCKIAAFKIILTVVVTLIVCRSDRVSLASVVWLQMRWAFMEY